MNPAIKAQNELIDLGWRISFYFGRDSLVHAEAFKQNGQGGKSNLQHLQETMISVTAETLTEASILLRQRING